MGYVFVSIGFTRFDCFYRLLIFVLLFGLLLSAPSIEMPGKFIICINSNVGLPQFVRIVDGSGEEVFFMRLDDGSGCLEVSLSSREEYYVEAWIDYSSIVSPYAELAGMTPLEFSKVVLPDEARILRVPLEASGVGSSVDVFLEWGLLRFKVEDSTGRSLSNMLGVVFLQFLEDPNTGDRSERWSGYPVALNFSVDGEVTFYVPKKVLVSSGPVRWLTPYFSLEFFWLDSWLLWKAGAIEEPISIYAESEDSQWSIRYYRPGEGGTLQAYVYTGTFRLVGRDGIDLPRNFMEKLKVVLRWPDGRITEHTIGNLGLTFDGTVKMVMNSGTLVSSEPSWATWRQPETPRDKPQAPIGPFTVAVYIGDAEVVTKTLRVHKARQDMPEIAVAPSQIILEVVKDVTLKLSTPFGTPMAGAEVEVSGPAVETVNSDGRYIAENGVVTLPYVLLSKFEKGFELTLDVEAKVLAWRDMPINYRTVVPASESMKVTVPKIGKLVVKVVGSRGQGISGADVTVKGPIIFRGITDSNGIFTIELVEGRWIVAAEKDGKMSIVSVIVTGGKEATVELKLDIFMTIFGWELSFSELSGLIILFIIVLIGILFVLYEFSVWRRKMVLKESIRLLEGELRKTGKKEKLRILEELYRRGEVSEEVYLRLKEKLEAEE